jgi:tetratricopeptide (TPR) repeat protein
VIVKFPYLAVVLFIAPLFFLSCKTTPAERAAADQGGSSERQPLSGGVAEEIRSLAETGLLSSMTEALELIRSRELGSADFGRVMNGVITTLIQKVYPDSLARLPPIDLPQTHAYTRIIREAEKGNYVRPPGNSEDFFEYVLPFLAVNDNTNSEILAQILNDLSKAEQLRPNSVLPHYFRGLIYERTGQYVEADAAFKKAIGISSAFYPALAGSARVLALSGKREEAATLFSDLVISYPDSMIIKRQLAVVYYQNRDWSKAVPVIDEILQKEPRDGEFLLMKAHVLIEQGNFSQVHVPLDTYASISPNNRFYLFLRARLQAEGNRNRDSALNYLRSILRANPDDEEALIYASRLLMESQRPADQAEGREFLSRLRQTSDSSISVLSLSLRDAVQRENWQEAQGYLNRILAMRRTQQDLIDGYNIERALGNFPRALAYARELYEKENSNDDYAAVYISALIDNGRREEASRLLENRISSLGNGPLRSKFFFLRSRLQTNDEAALGDLRSSLFEDPRNLDALIAMFEVYHRRREERRAVHYLRQALAISPDNPRLKRYEREYASLLGRQ